MTTVHRIISNCGYLFYEMLCYSLRIIGMLQQSFKSSDKSIRCHSFLWLFMAVLCNWQICRFSPDSWWYSSQVQLSMMKDCHSIYKQMPYRKSILRLTEILGPIFRILAISCQRLKIRSYLWGSLSSSWCSVGFWRCFWYASRNVWWLLNSSPPSSILWMFSDALRTFQTLLDTSIIVCTVNNTKYWLVLISRQIWNDSKEYSQFYSSWFKFDSSNWHEAQLERLSRLR